MKTTKISKELLIIGIATAPLLYFIYIWSSLAQEIPIHLNTNGILTNYGNKSHIGLTLILLTIGSYLFLMYIPKKDRKKNFPMFRNTYDKLRFILTLFISSICFTIISSVQEGEFNTISLYLIYALLVSLFGNYMGNIRPNNFIGIRTPWTLKSELTWKKTHFAIGKLWFLLGILLVILIIMSPANLLIHILIGGFIVMVIFPIVYSYLIYSNYGKSKNNNINTEKLSNKNEEDTPFNESDGWFYSIYFNRSDSRIIVPRKYKVMAWTVNLGNPYTYILIAAIVGLIMGVKYFA